MLGASLAQRREGCTGGRTIGHVPTGGAWETIWSREVREGGAPLPLWGFWAKSEKQRSYRGGVGINVRTKEIREIRRERGAVMDCRERS